MFEINGEKYFKVFECGKIPSYMDPQHRFNEDYISQVARNYDPENVHEAPFWVGHPDWRSEPRAGGWIKKVAAIGKELYVSFSNISEWMKELYDSGEFKKCSVEMGDLEVDSNGTVVPYLWALGATNIPAVKGLPVMKFSDRKFDESRLKNKVCFSLMNFDYNLKPKPNIQMEQLKKLAASLNITLTGSETEEQMTKSIEEKTAALKASESAASDALRKSEEAKAVKLVDDAIEAGKIVPAQKDDFTAFAKSNYEGCAKLLASMAGKPLTGDSGVATGSDAKPAADLLSQVAYEDVLREPEKYVGKLTDEQFEKMKAASARFADTAV